MLRLTLLRSPKWPDPDADMGHQHFHYALYPHAGTWKDAMTVRQGWEYNYPLQAALQQHMRARCRLSTRLFRSHLRTWC